MRQDERRRPGQILVIEDHPGERRLILEALGAGPSPKNVSAVGDGVEAMAYLRRQGSYANAVKPGLILLDLNLPRKDGREVLGEIKTDAELKRIPVVILTTSRAEMDVTKSYNLHANCYVVKPVDLDQFISVIRTIEHFWFAAVTLPPV